MYTYTRANPCVYTYDIRPQTKPVPTYIMNAAFAAPGTVTGVIPTKSRALNIHGALEQTRSAGSPPLFARLLAEEGREKSCRSGQSHPGRTACLGARDGGAERPDGLLRGGAALRSGADFCSRILSYGHDMWLFFFFFQALSAIYKRKVACLAYCSWVKLLSLFSSLPLAQHLGPDGNFRVCWGGSTNSGPKRDTLSCLLEEKQMQPGVSGLFGSPSLEHDK